MSKLFKSALIASFVVLISGASFLAGYGMSQRPAMAADDTPQRAPSPDDAQKFKVFWEAWSWAQKEFYRPDSVDTTRMTYGAIRGMLQTLGDPYTLFVDPQERQISETQLMGGFEGIGVSVEMKTDGRLRVVAPHPGSPGEAAGMRSGDVITHVNDEPVAGLNLVQAVTKIRGPKGTAVSLILQRPGTPDPIAVSVTRAAIKVDSVRAKMLDQGIGYIRVSQFGIATNREFATALRTILEASPKGLILDLRANPGGFLTAAVDVASQFLTEGIVLRETRGTGEKHDYPVKKGGLAPTLKTVVLVDKGSASASEIVGGALQDQGRAVLVGEQTFGKGSMQSVHHLSDGSSVHVTIAQWLTPNGRPINGTGLTPDVSVDPVPDSGTDTQLERAIQLILEEAPASAEPPPSGVTS